MYAKLYHEQDPHVRTIHDGWGYSWHFVYLHGEAEHVMQEKQKAEGWPWKAPDLFVADQPQPACGEYEVELYGHPAIAVIAVPPGSTWTSGRIALSDDAKALAHARKPEEWR